MEYRINECPATTTLASGEVVACTIWWSEEDVNAIHKAGIHTGSIRTARDAELTLMWYDKDSDSPTGIDGK